MNTEEERERATVYMDGLAQMRSDWAREGRAKGGPPAPKPDRGAHQKAPVGAGGASGTSSRSGTSGARGRSDRTPGGTRGRGAVGGKNGRGPQPKGPRR